MLHARIPAAQAASLPLAPHTPPVAAERILSHHEQGRTVAAAMLRSAMDDAFGASDAAGAWDWKTSAASWPADSQARRSPHSKCRLFA